MAGTGAKAGAQPGPKAGLGWEAPGMGNVHVGARASGGERGRRVALRENCRVARVPDWGVTILPACRPRHLS
jgi:hypothetical protein